MACLQQPFVFIVMPCFARQPLVTGSKIFLPLDGSAMENLTELTKKNKTLSKAGQCLTDLVFNYSLVMNMLSLHTFTIDVI